MITYGGEVLMFFVTLTKLIFFKIYFKNVLHNIPLNAMFLACKKVFCVADICIVY